MTHRNFGWVLAAAVFVAGSSIAVAGDGVGVVSHIRVVSDKVADVSSLEAWKKSFIKEGMSDKEKALAVFNTQVAFQQADAPPEEFLQRENAVLDPIKTYNVYGYTMCSISAADIACLARYVGLKARNATINNHTIPEMCYNNAWHMTDADLIEYFPKADGEIASLPEIVEGVSAWLKEHPDFPTGLQKKNERYKWMGSHDWKKDGPEILSRNPFYDANGWLPCGEFAWGDTVHQFARIDNHWESCYSMGYEVNVQLRVGEKLTRNWGNKGLHVNMDNGGRPPGSLRAKVGVESFRHSPQWGDLAPGRVGNGTIEYDVPLGSGAISGARMENVVSKAEDSRGAAVHVKDAGAAGVLDIRMPSSYVFLGGEASVTAAIGDGGEIKVLLSDNNGLDWKELGTLKAGEQRVDLKSSVLRRYSYVLRFVMKGAGTGIDALRIVNDIQESQRALPALGQGENVITFGAGPQEGTVTVEGAMDLPAADAGKQLRWFDFHPTVEGFDAKKMPSSQSGGSVTFPVKTPGDMTRVRASDYFLSQGGEGVFVMEVSFDEGKTWNTFDQPTKGDLWQEGRRFVGRYAAADAPAGTRAALVRYRATGGGQVTLCNARIDADYKEPAGGFAPVQVTYVWEEGGVEKKDVHVAKSAEETYKIKCEGTPVMKSLVVELAGK